MKISIIVPVLNEARQIQPFLRHLRARAPRAEVIVVDGGSDDGTPVLAADFCDRVITMKRSRPAQMNAGAKVACGDVLWFLHADCEAPPKSVEAIVGALADPRCAGGCFRVRIPKAEWIYRVHDGFAHYVGWMLRVRCGDHGIFIRRKQFEAIGGYPEVPLMEDVELFRATHARGRVAWLTTRLLLSSRRHEQVGVYWYTFICAFIVALYCMGVRPKSLARIYAWLVPSRHGAIRASPLPAVEDELFSEFRSPRHPSHAGTPDNLLTAVPETTAAQEQPLA
jgi:rSAM/selenodomain-associated transferase 2